MSALSSPGNRAYCYAELAVSSLATAVIIASTILPTRGGMARLSWPNSQNSYDISYNISHDSVTVSVNRAPGF